MKSKLNYLNSNNKGQALFESLVILPLIISLVGGFFIYIYRSSIILWSEYHLNQAINCENSTIIQSNKYLAEKKAQGHNERPNLEEKKMAHRKNRNCLAKAKADIQKISPWEKIEVKRNGTKNEYEVNTKWAKSKILKIEAKSIFIENGQKKIRTRDL